MPDTLKLPDDGDQLAALLNGEDPTRAALWRAYREAAALLRDLEAVETVGGGELTAARRYIAVITAHVEPLRRVVDYVEFLIKAEKIVAGLGGTVPL